MPKKRVKLSPQTVKMIKNHLTTHGVTQENLADQLKVTPKTLSNWFAGKTAIDAEKLDVIVKIVGIGIEDLLNGEVPEDYVFNEKIVNALQLVSKATGLVWRTYQVYERVAKLFSEHVSFVLFPRKGFFQIFEHDSKKEENYYFHLWLVTKEPVENARFIFSFTLHEPHSKFLIRIDYGEIIVSKETVEIKQYFQPPNYQVKRPAEGDCIAKVATWFDKLPHAFVVVSDTNFSIEKKGRISEDTLKQADDIATFWKHFFFHG